MDDRNLSAMADDELLEHQQELTRTRLHAIERGRQVQAELDRRAAWRIEQRAAEDRALGAVTKPPTQHLFGNGTEVAANG